MLDVALCIPFFGLASSVAAEARVTAWSGIPNADHITFLYGMASQALNEVFFRRKNGFFWRREHAELMDDCRVNNCALSIFMDAFSAANEKRAGRSTVERWAR